MRSRTTAPIRSDTGEPPGFRRDADSDALGVGVASIVPGQEHHGGQMVKRIDAHAEAELRPMGLERWNRRVQHWEPFQGHDDPVGGSSGQRAVRNELQHCPTWNEGVVKCEWCTTGPTVQTFDDCVAVGTADDLIGLQQSVDGDRVPPVPRSKAEPKGTFRHRAKQLQVLG